MWHAPLGMMVYGSHNTIEQWLTCKLISTNGQSRNRTIIIPSDPVPGPTAAREVSEFRLQLATTVARLGSLSAQAVAAPPNKPSTTHPATSIRIMIIPVRIATPRCKLDVDRVAQIAN